MTRTGHDPSAAGSLPVTLVAPAKLTLSLRVVGVRADGYHLLDSEMVSLDLADQLVVRPGDGLWVRPGDAGPEEPSGEEESGAGGRAAAGVAGVEGVPPGPGNLVSRALRAVGRRADVELVKRVPAGAGLGGGSSDAAAVLRWAGCADPEVALALGSDVPYCLRGGRARVGGIGEHVEPLPHEDRAFTLLLLPFGMDTGAVYRAWDAMAPNRSSVQAHGPAGTPGINDLETAAVEVDRRLSGWKAVFAEATGRVPTLAGSGSTWFVEGTPTELGLSTGLLELGRATARVVGSRTVPGFG